MIAAGEPPNVGPFIGVVEDKPFGMAFTDPERAAGAAKSHGLAEKDTDIHLLAIPVAGFVQTVQAYIAKGVYGVMFNDGAHAFYTPLTDMAAIFQHHRQQK